MEDLAERLAELDIAGAMREAFGNCPKCGKKAVAGYWLKWCERRGCQWIAPKRGTQELAE